MNITVNGTPIADADISATENDFADTPNPTLAAARALTVRLLLSQRAQLIGIEADSEAAALEKLIEQEAPTPDIDEREVQRYYEGNRHKFRSGDLFEVRHILFDTTTEGKEGVRQAEALLLALKDNPEHFADAAKKASVCSSANMGGQLGQLSPGAVVPEFWSALVAAGRPGLIPTLVETRFGHHIVQIDRCAMGQDLPFEAVQGKIRDFLVARLARLTAQRYIADLIASADIRGIDLSDVRPAAGGPPAGAC